MLKLIPQEVWAFDVEWVPDPESGRRVYGLPASLSDDEVRRHMWEKGGATDEDPQPYLKTVLCRVVSIASVIRRQGKDGSVSLRLHSLPMPDALDAAVDLMEADPSKLKHRNAFNVSAMSFDPEIIAAEIKKHIPDFKMDYNVDPMKKAIAETWPNSMDDSAARKEWGWNPKYKLPEMTIDMLEMISKKLGIKYK